MFTQTDARRWGISRPAFGANDGGGGAYEVAATAVPGLCREEFEAAACCTAQERALQGTPLSDESLDAVSGGSQNADSVQIQFAKLKLDGLYEQQRRAAAVADLVDPKAAQDLMNEELARFKERYPGVKL